MTSGITIAKNLWKRGYKYLVPLLAKAKSPTIPDWPNLVLTFETLKQYFRNKPHNVGIILGREDDTADLDLDSEQVRALAPIFLPETARFGRASTPSSHWLFQSPIGERVTFIDPLAEDGKTRAMLLEVRGKGCQTMAPGSVHPSGELVEWENDVPPLAIAPDELRQRVALLAVVALCMRYWPKPGARHDATVALAGVLAREGLTEDALEAVMLILNDGDNPRKHAQWARDSIRRVESGKPLQGIPSLEKIFPKEIVQCIGDWLGQDVDPGILEMNAEFAVAWNGGGAIIIREYYDEAKQANDVVFVDEAAAKLMLANRRAPASSGRKGESLYDFWKRHPLRRSFYGVVFFPGGTVPGYYNLWRGWAVIADATKSCRLYLQHILLIICAGNQTWYKWLICWMADAVQHPGRKPGSCVVLRGPEGAGKGLFVQYFAKLYGAHFVHLLQAEHFVGRFNGHLKGAALVFADEAFFAGDKGHDNVLKGLITEETIQIEQKFKDVLAVRNSIRLIMATNSDWAVPASMDARRYFILDVLGTETNNPGYFDALTKEMAEGGPGALMAYLLAYEIPTDIDVRRPPTTEVLLEQKIRTIPPFYRFLYGRLQAGKLLARDSEELDYDWVMPWDEGRRWVPVSDFYDEYIHEAQKVNDRFREAPEIVGRTLNKILGSSLVTKRKLMPVFPQTDSDDEPKYKPVRSYGFPSLQECRDAWERAVKQSVEWEPLPPPPGEIPEPSPEDDEAMQAVIASYSQKNKSEQRHTTAKR